MNAWAPDAKIHFNVPLWDCCAPRPQKPVRIFCVVNRLKMLSHMRIQLLHSKLTGI